MDDLKTIKNKRVLVIDSTILNALQKCPYYTFLAFHKNLRTQVMAEPLERGDLTHHILEHYYLSLKDGAKVDDARDFAIEKGRVKYPNLNMDVASCEWILQSFTQYVEVFRNDGIKVLEVEKAFMMKVYEDEELIVYYSGKIDLICELPLVGVVPIDHKSRARRNEETELNNQFIGYAIHTDSNFVYVNEFGLQTSKKPEEKFRRMPLSYTDGMKAHWHNNVLRYWVRQLDFHLQENIWPEVWNPWHCKNCVFSTVCKSSSDEERYRKLQQNYIQGEPWDVTKVLEGEAHDVPQIQG